MLRDEVGVPDGAFLFLVMQELADCVYYAVGMRSLDGIYEELASLGVCIAAAGDCKKTGKISGAVHASLPPWLSESF